MDDAELHKYLAYLDGRSQKSAQLAITWLEATGIDIPRLLMNRYGISRRWSDRASNVSLCKNHALKNENACPPGITAPQDRSRSVRRFAGELLAAGQRRKAIEQPEKLLPDEVLRDDVEAGTAELEKQTQEQVRRHSSPNHRASQI